jgi:hypothetical protein
MLLQTSCVVCVICSYSLHFDNMHFIMINLLSQFFLVSFFLYIQMIDYRLKILQCQITNTIEE